MGEDDFERRVGQFRRYIERMHGRSREEMEFCFVIFEEAYTDEYGDICRSKPGAMKLPALASGHAGNARILRDLDKEMEAEHPRNRYVQVGFEEYYFFVDLPTESLFPDEADEITATRVGFRRASRNPVTPTTEKHIRDFDPLQKFYLYGEEPEASEDVASIFFEVHGLPPDTRLYVSAHSASGRRWEVGEPTR